MIDIKFIRENPKLVEEKAKQKGYDVNIQKLLRLDEERRKIIIEIDEINRKRNRIARGDLDKNDPLLARGKELRYELYSFEEKRKKLEDELDKLMFQIPNIPLEGVPTGNKSKNEVIKIVGKPKKFDFTPRDHLELGENLNIIDVPRAAKVSGTRFAYLKKEAVILEFALIQFALDFLMKKGFIPVIPPAIIKKEITDLLGYWHGRIDEKHSANENYYLVYDPKEEEPQENPEKYLIGTAEHVIVPMHRDEVFGKGELPKRYVAFSSSFRREAGSYGKDTRGIFRVHQFDKVEMVSFVRPEDDQKERGHLLSLAESLIQGLGVPYQLVKLASSDLSFPTAETIDIETWIPSQNKYQETHSISTTTDFQARRLGIMFQDAGRKRFVHIINGTAFAIGRTIIALIENNQREDGSVEIPKVLQPYVGKDIISPQA